MPRSLQDLSAKSKAFEWHRLCSKIDDLEAQLKRAILFDATTLHRWSEAAQLASDTSLSDFVRDCVEARLTPAGRPIALDKARGTGA